MWINTEVDFGLPAVRYTLNLRSMLGTAFMKALHLAGMESAPGKIDADPVKLEKMVRSLVLLSRPDMKPGGLVVADMGLDRRRMQWSFYAVHPDLPRSKCYETREERLERCPVCLQPLPTVTPTSFRVLYPHSPHARTVEVCGPACVEKPLKQDYILADAVLDAVSISGVSAAQAPGPSGRVGLITEGLITVTSSDGGTKVVASGNFEVVDEPAKEEKAGTTRRAAPMLELVEPARADREVLRRWNKLYKPVLNVEARPVQPAVCVFPPVNGEDAAPADANDLDDAAQAQTEGSKRLASIKGANATPLEAVASAMGVPRSVFTGKQEATILCGRGTDKPLGLRGTCKKPSGHEGECSTKG